MIIENVYHSQVGVNFWPFFEAKTNGYIRFSSSEFLPFVRFSFTLMLYVISLTRTSVTCHKAVNRVNSLKFLL